MNEDLIKKFRNKITDEEVYAIHFTGDRDTAGVMNKWVNSKGGNIISLDEECTQGIRIFNFGGWQEVLLGDWLVYSDDGFESYTELTMEALMAPIEEVQDSNLVIHARRELELIGEDPETIAGVIKVIQAFADMGHSGGSASVVIPMINQLLQYQPLSSLSDDPDEWIHHTSEVWGAPGGVWQNVRQSEAFSTDGGKTYYVLSECNGNLSNKPMHTSRKSGKAREDADV